MRTNQNDDTRNPLMTFLFWMEVGPCFGGFVHPKNRGHSQLPVSSQHPELHWGAVLEASKTLIHVRQTKRDFLIFIEKTKHHQRLVIECDRCQRMWRQLPTRICHKRLKKLLRRPRTSSASHSSMLFEVYLFLLETVFLGESFDNPGYLQWGS